mgnify:CR=1 FL=1
MTIQVQNVTKAIRGITVLQNVSLTLESGIIYGLRGVNGSGKTMLMRCICGLVIPDNGCDFWPVLSVQPAGECFWTAKFWAGKFPFPRIWGCSLKIRPFWMDILRPKTCAFWQISEKKWERTAFNRY